MPLQQNLKVKKKILNLSHYSSLFIHLLLFFPIINALEVHETRNLIAKDRRFSASCAIVKVTYLMIKPRFFITNYVALTMAQDATKRRFLSLVFFSVGSTYVS